MNIKDLQIYQCLQCCSIQSNTYLKSHTQIINSVSKILHKNTWISTVKLTEQSLSLFVREL